MQVAAFCLMKIFETIASQINKAVRLLVIKTQPTFDDNCGRYHPAMVKPEIIYQK